MRIGLFIPCFIDVFFPEVGITTLELLHAYRRSEFREGHYAAFHTGPSAAADIVGVLIDGAQGVRSLSVLPLARAERSSTWCSWRVGEFA
jgi:hypothetical protein